MERVSFKVSKALKEAGYPQDIEDTVYLNNGELYTFNNENPLFKYVPNCCCDAPCAIDVWLWLWREKGICIEIKDNCYYILSKVMNKRFHGDTIEEAIIAAIEYLVQNNLIK